MSGIYSQNLVGKKKFSWKNNFEIYTKHSNMSIFIYVYCVYLRIFIRIFIYPVYRDSLCKGSEVLR